MILGDGEWITVADLPRSLREGEAALPPVADDLRDALRAYEKIHIENAAAAPRQRQASGGRRARPVAVLALPEDE